MNEIIRGNWAEAICNGDFICVETWAGYRGAHRRDPKGHQNFVALDASDEDIGVSVLDALAHSRFVLPERRTDVWQHPEAEFDFDLYDYKKSSETYQTWTKSLMQRFGYKTKRALFKDMESCAIESIGGVIKIVPKRHVKLEAWEGLGPNNAGAIEIPANSSPAEIGAALRLAFIRCTG